MLHQVGLWSALDCVLLFLFPPAFESCIGYNHLPLEFSPLPLMTGAPLLTRAAGPASPAIEVQLLFQLRELLRLLLLNRLDLSIVDYSTQDRRGRNSKKAGSSVASRDKFVDLMVEFEIAANI